MEEETRRLERALNEMTAQGLMLDALQRFYAAECIFTEGDGSRRVGRQAQHDHLSAFFASLKGLDAARLHAQAADAGVGLSEWTFEMTAGDGTPIVWNEVLVREWRGDRVISERFYPSQSAR